MQRVRIDAPRAVSRYVATHARTARSHACMHAGTARHARTHYARRQPRNLAILRKTERGACETTSATRRVWKWRAVAIVWKWIRSPLAAEATTVTNWLSSDRRSACLLACLPASCLSTYRLVMSLSRKRQAPHSVPRKIGRVQRRWRRVRKRDRLRPGSGRRDEISTSTISSRPRSRHVAFTRRYLDFSVTRSDYSRHLTSN